ncbi:MAG TPA: discoidin domain-containing protein, partial [Planctomycetota bacterium]|nr:discoidin domain-containing protein [Planctomycetota bacterium]
MGARYRIQMLGYKGNKDNEGIRDYEVYVTDSESGAKEDWGTPAITGQFPAAQGPRFDVDLIGSGRYLILWGTKHSVNMMSDEVWLSGLNLDPVVSSFTVSDATSGSTTLTNSTTVAVDLTGTEGENSIAGYMITETPDAPDAGDSGWALPAPTSFAITTGEGVATLYPWVKDNNDVVIAGPPASITYSTASPVASDVGAYWTSSTTAIVGWATDVPAIGRVFYREAGMTEWYDTTALETSLSTRHIRSMVDLVEGFDYEFAVESNEVLSSIFTYTHTGSLNEIPKPGFGGRMVATAFTSQYPTTNLPAAAIDAIPGNALNNYWCGYYGNSSPVWLRIDLGVRHRVLQIGIQGHKANHGPDLVKIYMTDSDITAAPPVIPPEWGPVLLEDRWPVDTTRQDRQMVGTGRYIIVYMTGLIHGSFIQEMWLYGDNVDPLISDFSVADTSSGSTTLTDSTTVNVNMTSAEGDNPITGYMITDTDWAPEPGEQGWSATIPETFTFTATEESDITLYAWVKDSTGVVTGSKPFTIHYQPPISVNVLDVAIFGQTDTTAVLVWTTDSPCLGRVQYREQLDPPADWIIGELDGSPVASHTKILTGLVGGTDYEFQLENNEQLSSIYTYTHTGAVPRIPKPFEGGTMTAIADTSWPDTSPAGAIDGVGETDLGLTKWVGQYGSYAPHWLRIDLQAPYRVQRVDVQGEKYDHGLNEVSIYVTDVDSTNMADWGEPTATGTCPREATRTTFNMIGYGRYVIIYGTAHQHGSFVNECWLYGVNINPRIDTFTASDQTTGSSVATDSPTVNVAATITLGANALTGYAITEEDLQPDPVTGTWASEMPTEYTITGPSGDTILYLWVKDSADTVVGISTSIYFEPAVPAVLSVQAYPHVGGSAMIVWNTNIDCLGKVFYREQGTETWLETTLETQLKTIHARVITGLTIGLTYEYYVQSNESDDAVRLYTHESELPEIPKPADSGVMTADASASNGTETPDRTIDSDTVTAWTGHRDYVAYEWLRIDLKDRYRVQRVSIKGDKYDHGLRNYQIYITDSDLTQTPDLGPMAEWGDPVATGQLPREGSPTTPIDLIGTGRYVIIYADNWAVGGYVDELWLYGVQEGLVTKPSITAFSATDQSTGSALFTNTDTVDIAITADAPEGRTVAGLLVTETSDVPATDDPAWADPFTSYTITGGEGTRTLFAWAKDDTDVVSDPVTATILFSTAVPTVLSKSVTDNVDGTATVAWTTDIAAEGLVQYGEVRLAGTIFADAPENALGTSHSVAINIVAGKNYKIVLVNNEVTGPAFYWPLAWPIEGDANMDCRVNILDLIFIRNKLNQSVDTGDNWQADVNNDA